MFSSRFPFRAFAMGLLMGLSLSSCKKEGCTDSRALNHDPGAGKDDGSCIYNALPTTQVTSPAERHEYTGEPIRAALTFEDDRELQSAKVRLTKRSKTDILFETEFGLSGTWQSEVFDIPLDHQHPGYASYPFFGDYEMTVTTTDADGERSEVGSVFTLEDKQAPEVTVTAFDETIAPGDSVHIAFESFDLSGIIHARVHLLRVSGGSFFASSPETVYYSGEEVSEVTTYRFYDPDLSSGDEYKVIVTVYDGAANHVYAESVYGKVE